MDCLFERPIAHRGYHKGRQIPENSLAAFQRAIDHRVAIELDVRLSGDGEVVVFHDASLERLTHGEGKVAELPLKTLQSVTLLDSNERIPTLKEVLEMVRTEATIFIEIKQAFNARIGVLEEKVRALLSKHPGRVAVISFNPYTLRWFKKHAPDIYTGQIVSACESYPSFYLRYLHRYGFIALLSRPNFLCYDIQCLPNIVARIQRYLGKKILTWTIRDQAQLSIARQYADNVIFENLAVSDLS